MGYLAQQAANAVPLAALYAALAYGYALVFGLTRRADIVYGALFAFAGQTYLMGVDLGWSRLFLVFPAALGLGAAVAGVWTIGAGTGIARIVLLPLYRATPNAVIVAGLGLLIVLSEVPRLAMDSHVLWLSPFLETPVALVEDGRFRVTLTVIQIVNTSLMLGAVLAGEVVLRGTRAGRIWRAVADDPDAAGLCGINAGAVFILSVVAASAIAALSGILATSYYGTMDTGAGLVFGLKVVMIAAVGGHGVPGRAALGAALVAVAETLWSGYAPILWRDPAIFALLVIILVVSRRERVVP